jgi:hypothetical protein
VNRDQILKEIESLDRRINRKKENRDASTLDEYKREVNQEIKGLEDERGILERRLRTTGDGELKSHRNGNKNGIKVSLKRRRL